MRGGRPRWTAGPASGKRAGRLLEFERTAGVDPGSSPRRGTTFFPGASDETVATTCSHGLTFCNYLCSEARSAILVPAVSKQGCERDRFGPALLLVSTAASQGGWAARSASADPMPRRVRGHVPWGAAMPAPAGDPRGPERHRFLGEDRTMPDPRLVSRAQRAATMLERTWERWRTTQGLEAEPMPPVSSYVGYSIEEPWGRPRVVFGADAEDAERPAALLQTSIVSRPRACPGPPIRATGRPAGSRLTGRPGTDATAARQPGTSGRRRHGPGHDAPGRSGGLPPKH
jgi:hypothetical protein